jgi:hypothetical protein
MFNPRLYMDGRTSMDGVHKLVLSKFGAFLQF